MFTNYSESMKKFSYLKALWSPFRPIKPKFYIGKTAIGTPYFLPRRWVKATPALAHDAAMKTIEKIERTNELNAKNGYAQKVPTYEAAYENAMRCRYPITKRIGFDFTELGWKTKWSAKDIRFEWAPIWSFVFFGYQIAITWKAPNQDHYWECWLYYELYTDATKSKTERIAQCREEFPCVWLSSKNGVQERIDYYDLVLRKKYQK